MVNLCVPVLKRYDLLRNMFVSLVEGTVRPDTIYVIDNGHDANSLVAACMGLPFVFEVLTPVQPLGLAEAWNWFIANVDEERLIVNDDLIFAPRSVEVMLGTVGDLVSALADTNAFSCFVIRNSCVEKVGLFDETISPGYAYFEDCDYAERMLLAGVRITGVECGVQHLVSQTIAVNTEMEWAWHHARFKIAQQNFVNKWGRMPDLGPSRVTHV